MSSYLRGQNVPIDPYILAEREAKRRKAQELQQAIKEQLEERENLKKIERERKWQQDKMEEERFARQVDIEKQRLEKEQRLQNEKQENQRKKEETMKQALERAALEAQRERERKRKEKVLALQSSLDETISIQKIGERTEIYIEGCQKSMSSSSQAEIIKEVKNEKDIDSTIVINEQNSTTPIKKSRNTVARSDSNEDNEKEEKEVNEEEDDGEEILIGTPIKLKKKNLENFRRKFNQRHADEQKTSDEELSTPKTIKSIDSNGNEENLTKTATAKTISDLEGIAIVLQTMPIMPTFVPLTNEMFGFNNLAFLMTAQNRLNSPNVMLPIISRDISTPSSVTGDKLDLSQYILPHQQQQSSNPSTITLQIQQVDSNNNNYKSVDDKIKSIPLTPMELKKLESEIITESMRRENEAIFAAQQVAHETFKATAALPTTPPVKDTNVEEKSLPTPTVPHDGTFTKEEKQMDAFTLSEDRYLVKENEVKILTPQKYRSTPKLENNARTVSTQTESFLFCEYCSFKHHAHHHHRCSHSTIDDGNTTTASLSNSTTQQKLQQQENNPVKPKEKKQQQQEDRPQWNVRKPPIKYLKASERDPFYGKNRKKRYLKKAASESDRNDDSCGYKECPLLQRSPLLSRRCNKQQQSREQELCSNLLPIKTDRFGRICLADEQNFIMNEALKRVHRYENTSDTESSIIEMKQKSFFLPRANDFQNIFVD